MKKIYRLSLFLAITLIAFSSCRNANQAKKAIEIAKKLSGKTVKASKKGTYVLQYGDDVARHIEFISVTCTGCNGHGTDSWGDTCEECEGAGVVYKIKTK